MNIKEYTNYILNKYQKEIIYDFYDNSGKRKNKIKDEAKLKKLISDTQELFQVSGLQTSLKIGPAFNYSDLPWIHIYNEKNREATKDEYLGISFNKENKTIEIWMGFGKTNLKKKEVNQKKNNLIDKLKTIEYNLKRGFEYESLYVNATVISKAIKLNDIDNDEVKKDLDYLANIYKEYNKQFNSTISTSEYKTTINERIVPDTIITPGENIAYIGFPGTGKSYEVRKKYLSQKDKSGNPMYDEKGNLLLIDNSKYEIVVFHKEYTNANFIGTTIPTKNDNNIIYKFMPGPFTRILKKAIEHPDSNFYLIIEELNKGDFIAILGDIFFLLERNSKGESVYEITNDLIANEIYHDLERKIYIPSNLNIIATMNITDEAELFMNTAFLRRWRFIYFEDCPSTNDNYYIKGLGNIKWGHFRKIINDTLNKHNIFTNQEEKRLGTYFINNSYLTSNIDISKENYLNFVYKVEIYLYELLPNKDILFEDKIKSLNDLVTVAKDNPLAPFKKEIKDKLQSS